eukprot:TRINITY_DN3160_c0_g3_i3.p2 TRINITY_DN3160_c0_g3~~TRINITY_DN3160_c0_g3_i3.p2  ORF type:complete len:111 (-),score=7.46 TRINITY_DN3160_c0_g3_i3:325-657(-)
MCCKVVRCRPIMIGCPRSVPTFSALCGARAKQRRLEADEAAQPERPPRGRVAADTSQRAAGALQPKYRLDPEPSDHQQQHFVGQVGQPRPLVGMFRALRWGFYQMQLVGA